MWFSALDINSAFWSIPIRVGDQPKTGFVTQNGHYEWLSMPFGLKNAAPLFQRILSGIIRRHNLSAFCVNYLDDILIFSKSFEEHIIHLEALFNAIKEEGFHLKFVKCNFASQSIKYLGHLLGSNSVQPLDDNLSAINDFPTPKTRRNVRQFLGKINFYRKFIPQSATLLEPFIFFKKMFLSYGLSSIKIAFLLSNAYLPLRQFWRYLTVLNPISFILTLAE